MSRPGGRPHSRWPSLRWNWSWLAGSSPPPDGTSPTTARAGSHAGGSHGGRAAVTVEVGSGSRDGRARPPEQERRPSIRDPDPSHETNYEDHTAADEVSAAPIGGVPAAAGSEDRRAGYRRRTGMWRGSVDEVHSMSPWRVTQSVRARSSSTATRSSSCASGMPTQRWIPHPNAISPTEEPGGFGLGNERRSRHFRATERVGRVGGIRRGGSRWRRRT